MTSHPNFDATLRGRIGDDVLQSVYASDQDMYPAPLTFAHLQSWVNACPDLSICFRRDGTSSPIGVVIALPIRRPHWDDLLCGALKETDIDPDVAFPRGRGVAGEEEVGLHVFHIERFPENDVLPSSGARKGGFAEFAVNEVVHRALLKRQWKVVGLSALTATPAGKKTFQRLGFAPTGYSEAFFVKKVGEGGDKDKIEMVCTYNGEDQPAATPYRVVFGSEMAVKYM